MSYNTRSKSKKMKSEPFIYLSKSELSKLNEDELDEYFRKLPITKTIYPDNLIPYMEKISDLDLSKYKKIYDLPTKTDFEYSSQIWNNRKNFYNLD